MSHKKLFLRSVSLKLEECLSSAPSERFLDRINIRKKLNLKVNRLKSTWKYLRTIVASNQTQETQSLKYIWMKKYEGKINTSFSLLLGTLT